MKTAYRRHTAALTAAPGRIMLLLALSGLLLIKGACTPPCCRAQEALSPVAATEQGGATLLTEARKTASLAATVAKVFGALLLVVGLLLLMMIWLKRLGLGKGAIGQGSLIRVLDTRMIAPKKHVAVIEVGGQCVVVGVTDQQISLLTKLDNSPELVRTSPDPNTAGAAGLSASFAAMLGKAIKTGKRNNQQKENH